MFLFTKPQAEAGKGYLRLDKNLWLYDPSVGSWERRTERERIGGTDTRRGDLDESRLVEEYDATFEADEKLGVYDVHGSSLVAKPGVDVAFPKVRMWVDTATLNVLKRQEIALSGRLMRTALLPALEEALLASRRARTSGIPEEMRLFDEIEKGNSTLILIKEIDLRPLGREPVHEGVAGVEEQVGVVLRLRAALRRRSLRMNGLGSSIADHGEDDANRRRARRARRRNGCARTGPPTEEELFGAPPGESPQTGAEAGGGPSRRAARSRARRGAEEADLFGGTGSPNAARRRRRRASSALVDQGDRGSAADRRPALPARADAFRRRTSRPRTGRSRRRTCSTSRPMPARTTGFERSRSAACATTRPRRRPRPPRSPRRSGHPGYDPSTGGLTAGARGPRVVLDQLWVNFDVGGRVFVTAGKQHVKWGVGKFWNPTDYLQPVTRNPLAVFDERVGDDDGEAARALGARGWNAYGVAVLEDIAGLDGADGPARARRGGRPRRGGGRHGGARGGRARPGWTPAALRRGRSRRASGTSTCTREVRAPHGRDDAALGRREPGRAARLALRARRSGGLHAAVVVGGRAGPRSTATRTPSRSAPSSPSTTRATRRRTSTRSSSPARRSVTGDPAAPIRQRNPTAFRPFYLGRHYAGAFVLLPSPGAGTTRRSRCPSSGTCPTGASSPGSTTPSSRSRTCASSRTPRCPSARAGESSGSASTCRSPTSRPGCRRTRRSASRPRCCSSASRCASPSDGSPERSSTGPSAGPPGWAAHQSGAPRLSRANSDSGGVPWRSSACAGR